MHLPRPFITALLTALIPALFLSCQTPLPPVNQATEPAEFESVWQYCKAWSIYQDSSLYVGRIPANPFVFASPAQIMYAIWDTLKGNFYTEYVPPAEMAEMSASCNADTAIDTAYHDTLVLDSLSPTTALLKIPTFDDPLVFSTFLDLMPKCSTFANIIIDLRGNLGGYIDQADSIITALVPNGTPYILARSRDFNYVTNTYFTQPYQPWTTSTPPRLTGKRLAVIMDYNTASASEYTLAGLYQGQLSEGYTMPIIGSTRSYGKGIGQVIIERRGRAQWMKITFLQIKGISPRIGFYHDIGIAPDTIPASLAAAGQQLNFSDQLVFYAAHMLDSTITVQQLQSNSPLAKAALVHATGERFGLFKRVSEDSLLTPFAKQ